MSASEISQIICQWVWVGTAILTFGRMVHSDFHGTPNREPGGFAGFIWSVIAIAIFVGLLYVAGAFSKILP